MGSTSEGIDTRRHVDQAYVGYWLAQTGTGYGAGSVHTDQSSLPRNPAESIVLRLRKTDLRNEVTTQSSPRSGQHGSRCQPHVLELEGLSKKLKPTGKPQDMLTWTQRVRR
jgi:hypothetical protein